MPIKEWLSMATKLLTQVSPTPQLEAELILEHVTGHNKVSQIVNDTSVIAEDKLKKTEYIVNKRLKHYPLQYLLGSVTLDDLVIETNDQVLIPREDTLLILNKLFAQISQRLENTSRVSILEIGVGSGVISVSIAKKLEEWLKKQNELRQNSCNLHNFQFRLVGTDINPSAIELTKNNLKHLVLHNLRNFSKIGGLATSEPGHFLFSVLGCDFDIEFNLADTYPTTGLKEKEKFDFIVSNPPYLKELDKDTWQPELNYEPQEALIAGKDGLKVYRKIFGSAKDYLNLEGEIHLEINPETSNELLELARRSGFSLVETIPGLYKEPRFMVFRPSRQ